MDQASLEELRVRNPTLADRLSEPLLQQFGAGLRDRVREALHERLAARLLTILADDRSAAPGPATHRATDTGAAQPLATAAEVPTSGVSLRRA